MRGSELALRSNLRQVRKVGPTHGRFTAVNAKKNTTAKLNYIELEISDCLNENSCHQVHKFFYITLTSWSTDVLNFEV